METIIIVIAIVAAIGAMVYFSRRKPKNTNYQGGGLGLGEKPKNKKLDQL